MVFAAASLVSGSQKLTSPVWCPYCASLCNLPSDLKRGHASWPTASWPTGCPSSSPAGGWPCVVPLSAVSRAATSLSSTPSDASPPGGLPLTLAEQNIRSVGGNWYSKTVSGSDCCSPGTEPGSQAWFDPALNLESKCGPTTFLMRPSYASQTELQARTLECTFPGGWCRFSSSESQYDSSADIQPWLLSRSPKRSRATAVTRSNCSLS
mmetsp:Transcript_67619/g.197911  ORF Transcript_67619/g.197911 Transcript_67619/m.197911 type:complete len:209 (-) Transcript_67619:241-867(-)